LETNNSARLKKIHCIGGIVVSNPKLPLEMRDALPVLRINSTASSPAFQHSEFNQVVRLWTFK